MAQRKIGTTCRLLLQKMYLPYSPALPQTSCRKGIAVARHSPHSKTSPSQQTLPLSGPGQVDPTTHTPTHCSTHGPLPYGDEEDASLNGHALCVTFRLVGVSLRGPGQSPVLPFACCVGLLSVGCCGRCSCWCRFCVCGAQWLVCWGSAGCGMVCRLRVSGAQ